MKTKYKNTKTNKTTTTPSPTAKHKSSKNNEILLFESLFSRFIGGIQIQPRIGKKKKRWIRIRKPKTNTPKLPAVKLCDEVPGWKGTPGLLWIALILPLLCASYATVAQ